MRALDFFAGDGSLLSCRVLGDYDVEAWDQRREALDNYVFHDAVKRVGDSFQLAQEAPPENYDLILLDAPAGPFGGWCEHFEALEAALPLLRDEGSVVFNVFTSPLGYLLAQPFNGGSLRNTVRRLVGGDYGRWLWARLGYYGAEFSFIEDYINFYCSLFKTEGYGVRDVRREGRMPGVHLLTFQLHRRLGA